MKNIFRILAVALILGGQKMAAQSVTNRTAITSPIITSNNFYSPSLGRWTNAESFFKFATNGPFHGTYDFVFELGNGGYIPAELWLGDQYNSYKDPTQPLENFSAEPGFVEVSPGKLKPYTKVLHFPSMHTDVYEESDPFHDAAAKWYLKAALAGNVRAQSKLGNYYLEYGRDYSEAARWYGYAYKQGDKNAMACLARMYAGGLGTPTDVPTAIQLYAEAENFYDDCDLCQKNGMRIPACMWWYVGRAKSGTPYESLAHIDRQFTQAELAAGVNAARAYLVQRYGTNFLETNFLGANFLSK
ncbi:MAG TPA: tetratricopeptide repeat protein [Candidatus Sulfotelmatobacter sp.]|nr:tetratricopeptide repeat protein [Candidatus Sulfotelmatobacter sp.]